MNSLKLLKRLWQALPLSDHTRWRVTTLLLEPILPFIKGSVVYNAYLRERDWQIKRIRPFYGDPLPKLPLQEKADLFFWSVIDWRFRIQRPQHLATELAKRGHRVFYISTSFVNTGKPGFELERMDLTGHLYNVRVHLKGRPLVYVAPPGGQDFIRLKDSIASLLQWTASGEIISVVQHPYWHELAKILPNSRLVYDCMDHHGGFGNTGAGIAAQESRLLRESDAVVTTAQVLQEIAAAQNSNAVLIRNATDFDYFSKKPSTSFHDDQGRRVLGYYGAIADWLDVELLTKVAKRFPECLLLLIGSDECGARQQLMGLGNVKFTGEVNYLELTHFLYGMDVCLLPFKVTPLTLATNPVKVYEYLSAGKPVVAVNLPELSQFEGLVWAAYGHDQFLSCVEDALTAIGDGAAVAARQAFAAVNTWDQRVEAFSNVLAPLHRLSVSIIVVTYNNLGLTHDCLQSLEEFTESDGTEIIVVDNASDDGTVEYLRGWEASAVGRTVIFNAENRGFAAANNQGLAIAKADYLVMLNNDAVVTPGWCQTLINHLRADESIGMIGPVTNNIGNEARIEIRYHSSSEMRHKARDYTLQHMGEVFPIRTLAFFCVMLHRRVYQAVGPLDEVFGLGFFEDDDYCRRVEQAGWQLVCAEDVFIHHHLSASFNKLGKGRDELLKKNRKIYESKWGPWTPHRHR